MQPIIVSVGPLAAASANNIALSQTTAGAANLTLNGSLVVNGVAILDTPRRILVTNVGNDSAVVFTVYGTTYGGAVVSEALQGTSGSSVSTTIDFATVTRVAASAATSASGVTVGTNGVAASRWVRFDSWASPNVVFQIDVSGTVNYTVQTTMNDPNDPISPTPIGSVIWFSSTDANVVGASTAKQSSFTNAFTFVRILLNSGSGTVTGTFAQFGVAPY